MMASMAEFVCRANYGLVSGNFELDMRDGEIRFKRFAECEGITPTSEMVCNSIHCPAAMFKRYGAGCRYHFRRGYGPGSCRAVRKNGRG